MNTQLDKKTAGSSKESYKAAFLKRLWKELRRNLGWKITALLLAVVMVAFLMNSVQKLM